MAASCGSAAALVAAHRAWRKAAHQHLALRALFLSFCAVESYCGVIVVVDESL